MITKALIYCRVSSQRQVDEGNGINSQEHRCRAYAKSNNYEIAKVFLDEAVSGGLLERPAMKELLKYMDENPFENYVVIFDDIKRFARRTEVHFMLKQEIYGRGGRVESPNFRFEDSPEGIFVETVMAAQAELERNQNKRQVIQKMKARLELGYWPFCMPKGLINKKDPIHGKILIRREPYASIYKEGIEKFRDGILSTILDFQTFINKAYKEARLKDKMSFSTATATLKEVLYAGYIEYPKWKILRFKAKHDGFISIETYEKVQERLKVGAKPWHRKDYHLDFPLRPYILCAKCDTPITGSYHTSWNKKRYPHYFCRNRACEYGNKNIPKAVFEGKFEELLSSIKPRDELIELAKAVLNEQWEQRRERETLWLEATTEQVKIYEEKIENWLERISHTEDEDLIVIYEKEIKKIKSQIDELKVNNIVHSYTPEEFGTAFEKVFKVLKEPLNMWRSEDYNEKRTILFMYFEDKLKYDYNLGFGTVNLAYPLKLITKKPPVKEASVEMSSSELESKKVM